MYHTVIMAALIFMLPESPVFLLSKDKEKAARKSLQRLRGTEYDTSEEIEQVKTEHASGDRLLD